jgi:hypothetical protein
MRTPLPCLLALLCLAGVARGQVPADELAILPGDFTLTGPAARQTLLVQETRGGKLFGQVERDLTLTSSDPGVVKIDNGAAVPVANGQAVVTAAAAGRTAQVKVTVASMDKPFDWSFRNHVQPVLAKFGCSSGACHGAAAGKNGFRLSLRGYDDEGDWKQLTRHAWGRRIVPADPSASLLLRKPTGASPHKGGVKIDPNGLEYRVLGEWIGGGAPAPKAEDPRIVRVRVVPEQVILKPGATQQIVVLADFTDGTTQDVTRWAKYTAADTTVATVDDPTGKVTVTGNGEGAITAWYLSKIAIGRVVSPYANELPPETFAQAPRRNFIDDLVNEKLASLNLPPSPPASDAEFVRRAFLDTVGVLPTADETRAFLADAAPDKRDKLIDALLARPEYVDYWAYKWSDLMLVNSRNVQPAAMWAYYNWIRTHVAKNTPWDQFARAVVTATGSTTENGGANFFTLHDDPAEMSENVSTTFLGMSINCAKCHNHPMEKWTNDQYYGMANLFARVRTKTVPGSSGLVVFTATEGDVLQPLTGKPQPPRPLDGAAVPMDAGADRRQAAADWLVSPANPYFARSIVNRVWANYMGVGLVEAVDDMRETNPPSNEKLMAALAAYLVEQKFDLKALMRQILQSQAYQRSSEPLPGNAGDTRFYSRYYPKRLMAEVLLDALSQASGAPTQFANYPLGWRAIQLPDSNVDSYFLRSFGRPERLLSCECERTKEPSMAQVLHIANGDTLNQKLKAANNRIDQLLVANTPDEKLVEEAYLGALSRMPTEAERTQIVAVLADPQGAPKRELLEDLFWGILSSKEFLFNR